MAEVASEDRPASQLMRELVRGYIQQRRQARQGGSESGVIVVWAPEAEQDRADIWDYIAADNPSAAVRMDELFSDAAARLAAHPKMGKTGKIAGARELIPHESYRPVYEIEGGDLFTATRAVHASRGDACGDSTRRS